MRLTRFCLENPTAVALIALAVAVAGLLALARMGRAVLPPIAFPVVAISAPYPGAGPAELERLVVEPIEDQLDGLAGVERVSAWAQDGIARIAVRFRYGTPLDTARADVQQAVDAARAVMPADLVPPVVSRDDPSQPPIYEAALSSVLLDPAALAELVNHTILPALRATPGVGAVVASGEPVRQVIVAPRRAALRAAGATVLDVERAVAQQNAVLPGGTFTTPLAQRGVGIRSGAATAAQLAALPVLIPGTAAAPPVGELAQVGDGFADPVELVQVDGTPAIVVVVTGARSSDATRTIAALRRTVARLASTAALVRVEELRTAAPFANAAVNGVLQTLGEGVVLTVAVILVFLRRWRVSLVAAIAIPASLAAAFAAMWAAGFTLDVLSLMGLSLTVGILVDDSIVIVEAIARAV
ncbi:MAG TPA: efflux RND transporter permease subunit, partial [Candidatus Elarobacter sp.]